MKTDGACHCGAVRFTVHLTDGLATARRCTCSYCTMRGGVAVSAQLDDIVFSQGEDNLTRYTFNTHTAQHFFCKTCGIYTHHQRRSNPEQYGVNLACLENHTPFLTSVDVLDGKSHPSDTGTPRVAGVLRYAPNEDTE
ncbi:Uncharacterized conserved protein [Jannaschia faecimaris]|uniref:Uncharacterized conserved protein n=1 Tax=Jannaschia faecimaris TaxID=1244108 RepID=A0A1H3JR69_9RHOB|nr:GFA family protein [Jannaschia faecimaris]SDY42433.1 Uncharacterized conserved protein [Jannaschia faecimaris]